MASDASPVPSDACPLYLMSVRPAMTWSRRSTPSNHQIRRPLRIHKKLLVSRWSSRSRDLRCHCTKWCRIVGPVRSRNSR